MTATNTHEADTYFLRRDAALLRAFLRAVRKAQAHGTAMPSKDRKARAYDAAYNLHRLTGEPRAHDVAGLRAVLASADVMLGGAR